jgi:hypothetical protein
MPKCRLVTPDIDDAPTAWGGARRVHDEAARRRRALTGPAQPRRDRVVLFRGHRRHFDYDTDAEGVRRVHPVNYPTRAIEWQPEYTCIDDYVEPGNTPYVTAGPQPAELLLGMMRGFVVTKALYSAAVIGVADHMSDEPRSVAVLADACECDADGLGRLLRALSSSGVFVEAAHRQYSLTPVGALLRSEPPSLRNWVLLNGGLLYQVFGEALGTFRTGRPASPRALGQSFFDYLGAHPEEGGLFDRAMRDMTTGSAQLVLDNCDLAGMRSVVDVGGGDGTLLIELLRATPNLHGVVVDTDEVVSRARQRPEAKALSERLEFQAGNFLDVLPAGRDLYLLAWILHDWDDEPASQILAACRQAMSATSRLLILESVLPPGDVPHFSRYGDLVMMVLLNGRERTKAEFSQLLHGQGLRLETVHTSSTPRSVLDVRPAR